MPNCVCDNGTCVDGYVCQNDVCGVGLERPDDVEPPVDAEDSAEDLGDITDNNDDFFEVTGILSGNADADWYTWHGADKLGYIADEPSTSSAALSGTACSLCATTAARPRPRSAAPSAPTSSSRPSCAPAARGRRIVRDRRCN